MNQRTHVHHITCTDVDDILEQKTTGEPLEPSVQKMLDRHLETCADCRDLSMALNSLSKFAEVPSDDTLDSLLSGADSYFKFKRRKRIAAIVGAVGAVAAAALVVLFHSFNAPTVSPSMPSCTPEYPVELAVGVTMARCVGTSAQIEVTDNGAVQISLARGAVGLSVDPDRPNAHSVVVATRFGEVRVKGTVLTVHLTDSDARVEVFRGLVEVHPEDENQTPFETSARRGAVLSKPRVFDLPNEPWGEPLRKILERTEQPETAPSDASDGPGQSDKSDSTDSEADNESTETDPPPRPKHKKAPVDTLLQEAQMFLIAGDWNSAAQKYQQIQKNYPKSQEAVHSLISLARIELRRLGRPEKALRYFNRYRARAPKGPLIQEVILGVAECHRRLGRSSQEAAELREFVKRYPKSPSAEKAKNRLKTLSKKQSP